MIRRFKKEDAKRCAEIINECHKSMPELKGKELKFLLEKYTPEFLYEEFPKEYVVVYEENKEIFGLGALINENELRWFYVDPEKQGRGIGRKILAHLESKAKKGGFKKIFLKSYYGSKTFYEKFGYKIIRKNASKFGDATFHSMIMEKDI
jgi:N-acetylglutamate synthase-like GNAT family acetyltransferase